MSGRPVLTTLTRHGTRYGYDKGCRCPECAAAKTADRRRQRDRARAENRPSFQRELASARARKERYRGTCKFCGAPTNGGDGRGKYDRCVPCANREIGAAKIGTGPTQALVKALLAGGPRRHIEIRDQCGLTSGRTANMLHRAVRDGWLTRVSRGVYRLPDQT